MLANGSPEKKGWLIVNIYSQKDALLCKKMSLCTRLVSIASTFFKGTQGFPGALVRGNSGLHKEFEIHPHFPF